MDRQPNASVTRQASDDFLPPRFSPSWPTFWRSFAELTVTRCDGKRVTVGEDQRAKRGAEDTEAD